MSYPYRVSVSCTAEELVSTKDKVVTKVAMDKILGDAEMKGVLCDVLREQGWSEDAKSPGTFRKKGSKGEDLVFDAGERTVTATVAVEEKIHKEKTVEVMGDSNSRDVEGDKERLRQKTERDLKAKLKITDEEKTQKRAELDRKVAEKLTAGEDARKAEIHDIVERVYRNALQRKAASMGSVQSVNESRNGDEYELTIKVTE